MSVSADAHPNHEAGSAGRWQVGPRRPRLPDSVVDVWRADLDEVGDGPAKTLSREEREREAGIAGARERRAWSRSRGVLRELLGRYLRCDASEVMLAVDARGKPSLAGPAPVAPLCFNLSHSGELALYAFSADAPVGID
ncbi:MAG TPA: hypothetical protein VH025_01585, partial [Solirubrobacteraceae bacterium]|nr:hypothetical protein [Solirubrobacteraceae bacterium]